MKTTLFVFLTLLTFSSGASAKSCIPGPSNPGGCMGIPDLNNSDADEGRDSGGGGRDSGGGGRDSGGTGDETVYSE